MWASLWEGCGPTGASHGFPGPHFVRAPGEESIHAEKTAGNNRRIVAVSSQHTIVLAIDWPESELNGLLGFAIRRRNPDNTLVWLEGLLGFKGQPHRPKEPIPSNEGPFQRMFWADYRVRDGGTYTYEVVPVYGQPGNLELRESNSVAIGIRTESNQRQPNQVYFNRAVIASQAYVRNFGIVDPESDARILAWLARGLDRAILDFIHDADTNDLRLDVAAYHLSHPAIIQALARLGARARVSLCWKKAEDQKTNAEADRILRAAGVRVSHRKKVPNISHDKFIISKDGQGSPQAVLTGSTNFTVGGVSLQNNVSHILHDPRLAKEYLRCFELLIGEDNQGLHKLASKWIALGAAARPDIELNFSPHAKGTRIDLDAFVDLVNHARSSIFFATYRATDPRLLDAVINPKNPGVVTQGLVDKVYDKGAGDVLLYHAAHQANPDVVPATTIARAIDPLERELARKGFNPLVHHKFILIDYNMEDSVVITGSANYSNNSSGKNDENTLILHRQPRVADMYFGEFFRLYEHYRSRWFFAKPRDVGRVPPQELYLAEDESWARKYYGDGSRARFLGALLKPVS